MKEQPHNEDKSRTSDGRYTDYRSACPYDYHCGENSNRVFRGKEKIELDSKGGKNGNYNNQHSDCDAGCCDNHTHDQTKKIRQIFLRVRLRFLSVWGEVS